MDEQTTADRLKQNIPADAQPTPIIDSYPEPEVGDPTDHSSLPLENYVLKQEVADFLNLPRGYRNNPELVNQLEAVIAWAHDIAGTHEPNDILHVLSRRQGEMGIRSHPDKLQRMYEYVKISRQIDGLYERARSLYG